MGDLGSNTSRPSCSPVIQSGGQLAGAIAPVDLSAGLGTTGLDQRARQRIRVETCELDRSHEYRRAGALRTDGDVGAPVDAVGPVDVEPPGGTEHDPVAGRRPPVGVGGGVIAAAVGLGLDDATDQRIAVVDPHGARQSPADQRLRHPNDEWELAPRG